MEQILFIDACVRPESRTLALAEHVLEKLQGSITTLKLYEENIPPLDLAGMRQRDDAVRSGELSAPILRYARQFADAGTVVVAAPYWDLLFPAVVRAYFEAVTVAGVTFRYSPEGFPIGLCRAKKLIYVTTAGGPIGAYNLGFDYVKALAQLYFHIPDVVCFSAEGLDIVGADVPALMAQAKETVNHHFA